MSLGFIQRRLLSAVVLFSFIIGLSICAYARISALWLLAILPIDALIIRGLTRRWKHPHGMPNPDTLDANHHPICYCPLRDKHKHPPA
jgi:hypothetical protein